MAKSLGSNNAINMVRAAINGLRSLKSEEAQSKARGKKLKIRQYLNYDIQGATDADSGDNERVFVEKSINTDKREAAEKKAISD